MKQLEKCKGVVVPMVSPFTSDGNIDSGAAMRMTGYLLDNECIPFVLGTTGESASIPQNEKRILVETVVEKTDGRAPVYAGIASTCFEESLQMAADFSAAGADYLVAHLPYFYPLTPEQMKEYFIRLADAVAKPLLLYNIPTTTHLSIPPEIIFELSEHPNIAGIKDSERDLPRQEQIIAFCTKNNFSHLIGWGAQITHTLSIGSDGLVPSTGNVAPGLYRRLYNAAVAGDFVLANRLQTETNLVSAVYQKDRNLGESLAALKVMMSELGLCGKAVLPPLTRLSREEELQIAAGMKKLKRAEQPVRINDNK